MSKPYLLLLFPGPTYRLHDDFGSRLYGLSKNFQGAYVTVAPKKQVTRFGEFSAITVAEKRNVISTMIAYYRVVRSIARDRRSAGGVQLIATYDPLRTGLLGLAAQKLTGAKLLCEVNGDYTNPANYTEISNPFIRRIKKWMYYRIARIVLSKATGIKLLYPAQISTLKIDLDHKLVRSMPSLVRTGQFRRLVAQPVILSVGFPLYIKGMDILIKAFKKVSHEFPDWRLKILGHYPTRLEIDRYIDGDPRIELHRAVHHSEMPEHIGRCGIFVLASRTEGMGRVLVEAMAAGKARIGTRVGGIPTVIEHEKDGLLVPAEDPAALADALRRLISDDDLRKRLANRSLERARTDFSEEQYFARTEKFYREVLSA